MRKISTALLICLAFFCPSVGAAENIKVTVKGMVCSFCAQGIKKTFLKNEKVKDINVDLDSKLVSIETKDDAALGDEEIRTTIKDAGYEVLAIERGKNA